MKNPFDKHQFATQPEYYAKPEKIHARAELIFVYQNITGLNSIPSNKGFWSLCNKQPDTHGSEINQLTESGLIQKEQYFGVDNDVKDEGIIEFNQSQHPESNWFKGDWLDVIEENYELFNPAFVYFDYTKTVVRPSCHVYLARTMNMCPPGTVLAANLMLSDGHSSKRFRTEILVKSIRKHLMDPQDWLVTNQYFSYKASRTEMGTYIFLREQ